MNTEPITKYLTGHYYGPNHSAIMNSLAIYTSYTISLVCLVRVCFLSSGIVVRPVMKVSPGDQE